jgi:RNA polymerase sigma-70 factor, ECF subfamily
MSLFEPDDSESEKQWHSFLQGLAAGQPEAYEQLWKRYGKRLESVAAKHFPKGLGRRLEPEDIVQSTCRSFFTRMVDGRLSVSDADGLWGLLCAIALNKTRMKVRFHLAKRRTLSRESDPGNEVNPTAYEPSAAGESPEASVDFEEQLQQAMSVLDPLEKQVLQLKLEDFTHEEIAERVHRSDRTIRRLVVRIQEKLQESMQVS